MSQEEDTFEVQQEANQRLLFHDQENQKPFKAQRVNETYGSGNLSGMMSSGKVSESWEQNPCEVLNCMKPSMGRCEFSMMFLKGCNRYYCGEHCAVSIWVGKRLLNKCCQECRPKLEAQSSFRNKVFLFFLVAAMVLSMLVPLINMWTSN